MIKFYDALNEGISKKHLCVIRKRLQRVGVKDWESLDKWHLSKFAADVKQTMAPSSAHTIFAVFKAFLGKFEDEIELPKGWREILNCKNELPMNTYLTASEMEAFANVEVTTDAERTVRDGFYVSCKTGLRHSDLVKLTQANFSAREDGKGYWLNYVSQKTKIKTTVPCSRDTVEKIAWLHNHGKNLSLEYYNSKVREIAKAAGITAEVSVFKAGKELSGPKWMFLSSHSARRSFCTVLADLGTDALNIMLLAGHSNPAMTARYVVRHDVKINSKVEKFLL